MKLSIIILCWNDLKVIANCLQSIYANTHRTEFEVIVSDNGSSDGSIDLIRKTYSQVRLIENGANLRFAKGNNAGIRASRGQYILILNPDTIVHYGALDRLVEYADRHPEAGAFGCRVLNPDGSYQESARPFPTIRGEWISALQLRPLGQIIRFFVADSYVGWKGDTERMIDWHSGCCTLVRGDVLKRIGGFDEQFFYYYEDTDLCRRIWDTGYKILFTPDTTMTHLGGQSTKQAALAFQLDSQITRYRYYYKYSGEIGARRARHVALVSLFLRRLGYGLIQFLSPNEKRRRRLEALRLTYEWNQLVDPVRLIEKQEEPTLSAGPARLLER